MGLGAWAMSSSPSGRAPVPQSMMNRAPEFVTTSIQEVLPPNRTVPGPGVAMEPRVPQKRTRMRPALSVADFNPVEKLGQLAVGGVHGIGVLLLGGPLQPLSSALICGIPNDAPVPFMLCPNERTVS